MKSLITLILLLVSSFYLSAQITLPPSGSNQRTVYKQYIGSIAFVEIDYGSPGVRGREGEIWGNLVPWGFSPNNFGTASEIPWRAGANENTSFFFSHDVLVGGKKLMAGKYGVHLIPAETGPWTLLFSKDNASWGSFFYDASQDALRVELNPVMANESIEWLNYTATSRGDNSCVIELQWEKLRLPIPIEVFDNYGNYKVKIKQELSSSPGFQWQSFVSAANFCLQAGKDFDQALKWCDYAISGPFVGQENFNTLSTKSSVLIALGRDEEAAELMTKAVAHASSNALQIHAYGRTLIGQEKPELAMKIFQLNYDKYQGAWPTTVGMMRGLSALGKYDQALKYAEMALPQAPDKLNQDNIASLINKLKKGEGIN